MSPAMAIALMLAQQKSLTFSTTEPLIINSYQGPCISGMQFDKDRGECQITLSFTGNSSPVSCEPVKGYKDTFRCAYTAPKQSAPIPQP